MEDEKIESQKIEIKKMVENDITGNYLLSDNTNHYFNDRLSNIMFLRESTCTEDIGKVHCYYEYLTELIKICKNSKNKPSVIYVGNKFESPELQDIRVDYWSEKIDFNAEPMYVRLTDEKQFNYLFRQIENSRPIYQGQTYRPLFIFADDFTIIDHSDVVYFTGSCTRQFINFVLLLKNGREFNDYAYEAIEWNCPLRFMYNKSGITDILKYYGKEFDKDKKEFVRSYNPNSI